MSLFGGGYQTLQLSFSLVLLAVVLAAVFRTIPRFIKACAMLISFFADMMLAQYLPFVSLLGGYSFAKGAVMFMAAHLLYIASFVLLIKKSGKKIWNIGFWTGCVITAGAVITLIYLYNQNPFADISILILGIIYGLIIGTLCTTVCTYAFIRKGMAFGTMVGILSFMASDMFIGLSKIGGLSIYNSEAYIWFFYPIGQLLILL